MLVLGRERESARLPVILMTSNDIFHHPEFIGLFLFFLHSLSKWRQNVSRAILVVVFIIQGIVVNFERSPYHGLNPPAIEPWLSPLTTRNLTDWSRFPEKGLPREPPFYGLEALRIRRPPPLNNPSPCGTAAAVEGSCFLSTWAGQQGEIFRTQRRKRCKD